MKNLAIATAPAPSPRLLDVPIVRVQLVRERTITHRPAVETPEDVSKLMIEYIGQADREHFVVVGLDAKNRVLGISTVHIGSLTMSIVSPRDVFKTALLMNACSIAVAHNHPSGDPTPSPEDLEVTKKLADLGRQLDIPVIDHVIVGSDTGRVCSFHRRGLI